MLVISDTSPLCYLILIELTGLLPRLFERILIPQSVYEELRASGSPPAVCNWIADPPIWLEIEAIALPSDAVLETLDRGEREAIALAEQVQADLVLLDERRARQVAIERGLGVVGLLGILGLAADYKLIDFAAAIDRLQETNFWASPTLIRSLLQKYQAEL
jgi:predicted nucleic acid-binding protein